MSERSLVIPRLLWLRMVLDLRRRGERRHESGAFLLGEPGPAVDLVRHYICYDDLDPNALKSGIVVFDGTGFAALWARCRELGMDVLGDVHTHGNARPRQSPIDQANPMMSRKGHVAFVLPLFATTWGWNFKNVAIAEYLGDYEWREWTGRERQERVRMSWR